MMKLAGEPPRVRSEDRPLDLAGRHVHFTGIGGCGMSGLARIVRQHGAICSGSDAAESPTLDALRQEGLAITLEQTARSLPERCDLLVVSAAIGEDHPQRLEAQRRGITVLKYAQLLGQLMLGRTGVAVAGTHGKSTTTSMLSHILIQAGLDPSLIVGANCEQIGGGWRVGGEERGPSIPSDMYSIPSVPGPLGPLTPSDILVAEACEYDRSFHNFHPTHALILNVEADHLDIYRNLDEIVEAFHVFARSVPGRTHTNACSAGSLLINYEMTCREAITADLNCVVETIGFSPEADWRIETDTGTAGSSDSTMKCGRTARLHHHGQTVATWRNPLPGNHMAYNAAAAAVTAHRLGAPWKVIVAAIESFKGLDRRMQLVGSKGARGQGIEGPREQRTKGKASESLDPLDPGSLDPSAPCIPVVDDYAHHPTEIRATLEALRGHYQPKRLICIFQPHQHSRTRFLLDEFAGSFSAADLVIVPDIYFVRDSEDERQAVTSANLVERLEQAGTSAVHLPSFDDIVARLREVTSRGDLVVTMGAGDVWKIARQFAEERSDVVCA